LLKRGEATSRRKLAELIARDRATITHWVRKYKDGRALGLLEVKQAHSKVSIVSGEA